MNKKEEKKIFWGYMPFDYRVSEALFSKMAERGWMVKSVTPYFAVFQLQTPKKRMYRAAVYDKQDFSDHSRAQYIQQWKKNGMHYACEFDRYYWFYTDNDINNLPEGFCSDESRLLGSAVWRKEIYSVILMLLAIGFGAIKLYNVSYVSFITYSEFTKLMLLPVFLPICFVLYVCAGIWIAKCRHKIRRGTRLAVPSYAAANIRRIFVFLPVTLLFLLLLLALALDACTGYAQTVILISPILVVACVVWIVRILKRHGQAVVIGRVLIILAMIICIAVYAIGNYRNFSSGLPEESNVARLSNLGNDLEVQSTSYVHTASPAVSLHFVYKESAEDGTMASTEFFQCRTTGFADRIYAYIETALEGVEADYELVREGRTIVYKEYKLPESVS